MTPELLSPPTALPRLAELARIGGNQLAISITEDTCFKADNNDDVRWIPLGAVDVFPASDEQAEEPARRALHIPARRAVHIGAYEWTLPSREELNSSIKDSGLERVDGEGANVIAQRLDEALQDILRRLHLCYPVFGVDAFSVFPLRRPTTIVPDTTAIHQGALDFICAFFQPWARVKIPSIVHMEILTQVDNYLKIRRRPKKTPTPGYRAKALDQHRLSQGGQRALLRIEFTPGFESERGDLGADPLRGVVTPGSDPEDKNLGLQTIQRCFGDRLIVETARCFQRDVRPDHPLYLLTSDQGMARMAMSEGIEVLYFQSRSAPQVLGLTVSGAPHKPFGSGIHPIPLTSILWELAVSFGRVKIATADGAASMTIWGIGGEPKGASWQPFHSREDLLWTTELADATQTVTGGGTPSTPSTPSPAIPKAEPEAPQIVTVVNESEKLQGWYRFSPPKLIQLLGFLAGREATTAGECQAELKVKASETLEKYLRFLRSGALIEVDGEQIRAAARLRTGWGGIAAGDPLALRRLLDNVPSFRVLVSYLSQTKDVTPEDDRTWPISQNATANYIAIAEAATLCCSVGEKVPGGSGGSEEKLVEKLVDTPNRPALHEFVELAADAWRRLSPGGDYVMTGEWLEALASRDGIHPVVARQLVETARREKTLSVYVEGSTPDTRYDRRRLWVLETSEQRPTLTQAYLYRGDFLTPGTASVRLKVQADASR